MTADPIRAIADAVLYEGYILWPYRRSALKNQRRFTFGGIYPPAHTVAHPDDPASAQTEVLVRGGPHTQVQVTVRFLQVVRRTAMRRRGDWLIDVDELIVAGERHQTWDEAVERELSLNASLGRLCREQELPIWIDAASEHEQLADVGALVRTWRSLQGALRVGAAALGDDVWRLTATVANMTPTLPASREQALELAFCSTHLLLAADGGEFVSLTDPPPELAEVAQACRNVGVWPVLVGDPGDRSTILASPIILEDYPRVAPESPGDLFDGGEIDQLLILNILALTDGEKAQMAASDPRAREILERIEALTPEQLMALHGTIREVGMAR